MWSIIEIVGGIVLIAGGVYALRLLQKRAHANLNSWVDRIFRSSAGTLVVMTALIVGLVLVISGLGA